MYVITANNEILAITDSDDLLEKISDHPDVPEDITITGGIDPIINENFKGLYRVEFHTDGELFKDPVLVKFVPESYKHIPEVREYKDDNMAILCTANSKDEALKMAVKKREDYFSKKLGLKTNNEDHFGLYRITFDKYGNMSDVGPILIKRVPEDYDFGVPKVSGDPEKHISVTCKANSNADAVYTAVVARTEYIKEYYSNVFD